MNRAAIARHLTRRLDALELLCAKRPVRAIYTMPTLHNPLGSVMSEPTSTIYVSGLSKSIATGLRVGYLAAPEALVPALERAIRATAWNTPALTVTIACRWLDDGTIDQLEARKRDDARHRQAIARDVLAGLPQDVTTRWRCSGNSSASS